MDQCSRTRDVQVVWTRIHYPLIETGMSQSDSRPAARLAPVQVRLSHLMNKSTDDFLLAHCEGPSRESRFLWWTFPTKQTMCDLKINVLTYLIDETELLSLTKNNSYVNTSGSSTDRMLIKTLPRVRPGTRVHPYRLTT